MAKERISLVMSLVCQRDPKLYTQCCLVGLHWSRMCHILGLSAQQIEQLLPGVLMHDERIDKLALQEEILEDKLIQGIYSFPDSLSKENCLLLVADTFVRCLLDTRDLQVSIKGLSHRLRVSPWMKEKISSQISYLPHTYQNRKKLLEQIGRERDYLHQMIEKFTDLSHPLVYGQSVWLDFLLVSADKFKKE